jgi:phospho-N-acetylmuramoyl-pentapeptide-transferase
MGGVVFIIATLVATIFAAKLNNVYVVTGLLTIITFGLIGVKDDLSKILFQDNSAGLTPRSKMFFQMSASLILVIILLQFGHNSELYVPFYKNPIFEMGLFALPFWVFVMVGSSNAVNLTDGLDGLATVPSMFALASLSIIVYITGNAVLSNYLLMPKIISVGEVVIITSALIGALSGFLWFNAHPAEVFMGDSGSLSLGAFIAYLGIITKSELLLILIGLIFVIETVSVMLQVGSFKLRKKRVFLMAPIHHHFEMKNWAENKIIVRFWLIAMMSNLIALATLKIR